MDVLLSPAYQPFTVAGLIMAGLVLIETVSLVTGFSFSSLVDKGFGLDSSDPGEAASDHGFLGGVLGWMNVGRVPALVFIITWLAAFAVAGFVIQTVASGVLAALPVLVASLASFLFAMPATRYTTRLVSSIVPRDESYAVSNEDLIGRVAEVTVGPLDQGPAGRIKVQDAHGNWHFLLAKAAERQAPIPVGAQVLIVDKGATTFLVIPAPQELTTSP